MRTRHARVVLLLLSPLTACQQLVGWSDVQTDDTDVTDDTGDNPDVTRPVVTETSPAPGDVDVPVNASIFATFSESMDPLTFTTATFKLQNGLSIAGSVDPFGGQSAVLDPTDDLEPDHEYTATVTVGTKDLAGNALAQEYSWSFTTSAQVTSEIIPPRVIFTDPEDLASGVPVDAIITATFSEGMDEATVLANFEVTGPGIIVVNGDVTYDALSNTGTFTPDNDLLLNTTYTATVVADAADLDGTPMDEDYVWTFSTSAPPQFDPPPVNLRSLASFVAVAGSTIDNSGPTYLNGDVGLSPGTSCIECTPPDMFILGDLYMADAIAAQAKADLVQVYIEARDFADPAYPPVTVGENLDTLNDGDPLPPGVYWSATSMDLAVGGIVTLDAGGDPDAFWIFQIGSTLTINTAARVELIGGARAANVFWAVGSSSTINANASFQGTVMAQSSNSVGANATVIGRLLCTTGAITLLSNTITLPQP